MTGRPHRWFVDGEPADQGWRMRAACRGMDPEWFTLHGGPLTEQNEAAYAVCQVCPVAAECLEAAVAQGDVATIRGIPLTGSIAWKWAECEWCGSRFARPPRGRHGKDNKRVGPRRFCTRQCAWEHRRRAETETVGRVSELASAARRMAA